MKERSAWVRLWFVWLIPALLVAANGVWLFGLRATVLGRGSLLAKQRDAVAAEVGKLAAQRATLAAAQQSLDALEGNLGAMRREQLGSMRERLVSFLVDITKRSHAAGLRPERINYAAEADAKTGMVHFSAIFGLSGTYEELRRCVNLLESSPQFVVVERLMVRSDDGADSLAVNVQLSVGTYFVDADTGMLRQLGIEDLPKVAAVAPASPANAGAPAEQRAAEEPRTDFTAVDAQVMEDLRAAVAGLGDEAPAADEDLFVTPEPPPSRRDRGRSPADRRSRSDSFMTQVSRREVSGGG